MEALRLQQFNVKPKLLAKSNLDLPINFFFLSFYGERRIYISVLEVVVTWLQ